MRIAEWVAEFQRAEIGGASIVNPERALGLAVAAARYYAGYGALASAPNRVTDQTEVTDSEWTVIGDLFRLYVDRERALLQEATRGMGADPYGRSTAEVDGDIKELKERIPLLAFFQPAETIATAPTE
jgi:hypothetical protein